MTNDASPPAFRFPVDEDAEDALWLAELIRGLRMFAESAGHPEVAAMLEEAHAAAEAAVGIPSDKAVN